MIARNPLFTDNEWNFPALDRVFKAIEEVAIGDLTLDIYPNQIEIITGTIGGYRSPRGSDRGIFRLDYLYGCRIRRMLQIRRLVTIHRLGYGGLPE